MKVFLKVVLHEGMNAETHCNAPQFPQGYNRGQEPVRYLSLPLLSFILDWDYPTSAVLHSSIWPDEYQGLGCANAPCQGLLNQVACWRQGCHNFISPDPDSSEAKHILPVGLQHKPTSMVLLLIYIYTWPAAQINTNTHHSHKWHQKPHPVPLSGEKR